MTLISLFTDASFCPRRRVAGWGMWAKRSPTEKIVYGNRLRSKVNDPSEAEFMAIANAFAKLEKEGWLGPGVSVIAATDCQMAIDALTKGRALQARYELVKADFVARRERLQFAVTFRHVKAHVASADRSKRQHVNELCDSIAKGHMRLWRDEVDAKAATRERKRSARKRRKLKQETQKGNIDHVK